MNTLIKITSFGEKDKHLAIDEETIKFSNKSIRREDIIEIKYWISSLIFYKFSIGRKYHIGFKTNKERIDIILYSYFGFGNNYFNNICSQIIEKVWEPITERIWDISLNSLKEGIPIQFGNCQVQREGIFIKKKQILIPWKDLHFEKKYNRLVLNNKVDPTIWTNIYFEHNWNIEILVTLLNWFLNEDGLSELENQIN